MPDLPVQIERLKRWVYAARLNEVAVLAVILLIVLGVWGFAELADDVAERETQVFDEWVLQSLRGEDLAQPPGPAWLLEAMRDITALGGFTLLGLAVVIATTALLMMRKRHAAILLVTASVVGVVLSSGLKQIFSRPRPEIVEHAVEVSTASFPSGHAMLSAVIYLTLGTLLMRLVEERRMKVFIITTALLLSFIVGFSRLYLGVHYPTDVLAGWAAGLSWALICWLVARYLQRRGVVEGEERVMERGV